VAWLAALAWVALFVWHLRASAQHTSIEASPARLWLMFASGACLYGFRARVPLSWPLLATALAVLVGCAGHGPVYAMAYVVALPVAVLGLAYLPRGRVLRFNRLGDYSYGVYIYAYPVQQTLLHLHPFGVAGLFCASMGVTLVCAVLSWHFIEKPVMSLVRTKPAAPTAEAAALATA
jgi:peptidoglycan/LPS O-acetylase OafA/YrhL